MTWTLSSCLCAGTSDTPTAAFFAKLHHFFTIFLGRINLNNYLCAVIPLGTWLFICSNRFTNCDLESFKGNDNLHLAFTHGAWTAA